MKPASWIIVNKATGAAVFETFNENTARAVNTRLYEAVPVLFDTYNGWTNYATWRVNLEMFDGGPDWFDFDQDAYDLGHDLKAYAEELIEDTTQEGLGRDYALAFLSDVNWYEIAKHMRVNFYVENNQPIPEQLWKEAQA